MLSRNAKLVGLVALLAGLILSCGKNDADINPLASRHLLLTMTMGSALVTVAQHPTTGNPAFDPNQHCVQWIDYKLNGKDHGQRLEISNQPCPANNQPFPMQTRVARLRINQVAGGQLFDLNNGDVNRRFGQFRIVSGSSTVPSAVQLTALCSFAQASERTFYQNNCSVALAPNGRITAVVAR